MPVSKVAVPTSESDYRPISITPILSRLVERRIVTSYIYPALQTPPSQLCFTDQFAFRPTGSTTAALIALLHTVSDSVSNGGKAWGLRSNSAFNFATLILDLDGLSPSPNGIEIAPLCAGCTITSARFLCVFRLGAFVLCSDSDLSRVIAALTFANNPFALLEVFGL